MSLTTLCVFLATVLCTTARFSHKAVACFCNNSQRLWVASWHVDTGCSKFIYECDDRNLTPLRYLTAGVELGIKLRNDRVIDLQSDYRCHAVSSGLTMSSS